MLLHQVADLVSVTFYPLDIREVMKMKMKAKMRRRRGGWRTESTANRSKWWKSNFHPWLLPAIRIPSSGRFVFSLGVDRWLAGQLATGLSVSYWAIIYTRGGNLFTITGRMNYALSLAGRKIILFYLKFLPLLNYEEEWLILTYYVSTCLSWSFVLTRCCALTWVTKILMRATFGSRAATSPPPPLICADVIRKSSC